MVRLFLALVLLFLPVSGTLTRSVVASSFSLASETSGHAAECRRLYEEMCTGHAVNYQAFKRAIEGSFAIDRKNRDILTLIDFSKPSTEERFYVFDLRRRKMLFCSVVSHGKNSGGNYATSFSNENGSHKSSLGFYLTEHTYQGRNGFSLVLDGLEKGINDRAKERAIVVHGAAYSNPSVARSTGRLGRSFGCPALPQALARPIINTIKEGTLLYIYAEDQTYLSQSMFQFQVEK